MDDTTESHEAGTNAAAAGTAVAYVERSFLPKATLEKSTTAKLKLEKFYESFILQLNELDKRCASTHSRETRAPRRAHAHEDSAPDADVQRGGAEARPVCG